MNQATKKYILPLLPASILLVVAIIEYSEHLPSTFYLVLRISIFLGCIIFIYNTIREFEPSLINELNLKSVVFSSSTLMIIIAIIFNPIFPFYFKKSNWVRIDIFVLIFFILVILGIRKLVKDKKI